MPLTLHKLSALTLAALLLVSTSLTGCGSSQTTTAQAGANKPTTSMPAPKASNAVLFGEERDTLSTIESLYNKDTKNPLIAARYGKALREAGNMKAARSVLTAVTDSPVSGTLANTELSAIALTEGDFQKAEFAARKAVKQNDANYRAWRNLGNALDAQEKYKEGEAAFRKAMTLWGGGDKVPIMNNLALNLAAQGYTDQALTLLYDAQKIDPDRVEIERNIRIIRTLSEPAQFSGKKQPFPASKAPE